MLAFSFDEYRDSERSIRERVEILVSLLGRGYACIYKRGTVVVGKLKIGDGCNIIEINKFEFDKGV